MFRDDWEVEFPEANFPLIAGRLCRLLALPRMFKCFRAIRIPSADSPRAVFVLCAAIAHVLSERILSLLPQPLSFHLPTHMSSHVRRSFSPRNAALAGSSRREKGLPPEFSWSTKLAESSQDWRMILPELKVASVLIVVTKLLWGLERFDGCVGRHDLSAEFSLNLSGFTDSARHSSTNPAKICPMWNGGFRRFKP